MERKIFLILFAATLIGISIAGTVANVAAQPRGSLYMQCQYLQNNTQNKVCPRLQPNAQNFQCPHLQSNALNTQCPYLQSNGQCPHLQTNQQNLQCPY